MTAPPGGLCGVSVCARPPRRSQVLGSCLLLLGLFPSRPATVPADDTLLLLRTASGPGSACPLRAEAGLRAPGDCSADSRTDSRTDGRTEEPGGGRK